jgi:uncharacterized LabA/DUF88 family protein
LFTGLRYVGFVDVGFLRAEGARLLNLRTRMVRPDAQAVITWFRGVQSDGADAGSFIRAYWYDGAFDPSHAEYRGQREFFDAIGFTPGVQLRLGHIAERASPLQRPIDEALRRTAVALDLDAGLLLAEFRRQWQFRSERRQKGVDTLMALDLVRLAGRGAFDVAVLITGDRDVAEAVRAAQDFGKRVVIATPSRRSVARELAQLADEIIDLDEAAIRSMLKIRLIPAA